MYLSDQDRGLLLSSNVDQALLCAAYDRFWWDVQKCCNQFQETSLNPVAIWQSSALGLIGTIQQKVDMTNNQSLIKTDMDVVCKIIEKFADSHADQSDIKLDRLKSSYLNAAFSTAMLATALRYRVLGRLCFAKIERSLDQRFNAVVNSHLAGILSTIKHYNTFWLTLSSTYLSSFVSNSLESAMIALWPETKSLVIPRFLAESKHYDASNDYCKHNEPFLTELSVAFHFFRGIALVGLGEPSATTASFFEEASQGIVSKDEPNR
ncbi:hypothetical protein M3Y98_00944200 [Aphelenchoides besseyi]|nr:hypothetical protein M3Y98_00944200 [Aphelenchoides besseyi]